MENNEFIKFTREKYYQRIESLRNGSTGKTVLMYDKLIDEYFVCKKYETFYPEHQEVYYDYFIQEIKILYKLNHPNIVRVFNYYLYPKSKTGFIIMEFVNGKHITDFIENNPDKINDLFLQAINGFMHLEACKILHRDIRPSNLMVTNNGILKIIDFGFGKQIDFDNIPPNSISLNWAFEKPDDFNEKKYDTKTEIYFVGKLFESLIRENSITNFTYSNLLSQMTTPNYTNRINTFFDINRAILNGEFQNLNFSEYQKNVYLQFANSLTPHFYNIEVKTEYRRDTEEILRGLENIYSNSILENYIQNPKSLGDIFLNGDFMIDNKCMITRDGLKNFLDLYKSVSISSKRIILNNLWQRLDKVNRYYNDELPF